MAAATFPGWLDLTEFLVFLILDKLLDPIDHVRFAVVCKEWHSLSKHYHSMTQRWRRKVLPMLMVPAEFSRSLYSVPERKIYINNFQLPMFHNIKRFCGCSHGWLAIVDEHLCITLMNPFAKEMTPIHLPPLVTKIGTNPDCVAKIVLSSDPVLNPNSYRVLALSMVDDDQKQIYLFKGEGKHWAIILLEYGYHFSDAIFYDQNQIYGVDMVGHIVSINVDGYDHIDYLEFVLDIQEECFVPVKYMYTAGDKQPQAEYLVKSTKGELWYVRKLIYSADRREVFRVYKVVFGAVDFGVEHVEVKNIGGEALFLGQNDSISVLASDFPGCQANCIYFIEDWRNFEQVSCFTTDRPCYMSIFNVEFGTTSLQFFSSKPSWLGQLPVGLWVTPSFNALC